MEFLLGVDAPVSFELLRQIVLGMLVDAVLALPLWAFVRLCLDSALPEDPRRRAPPARVHDRRAQPALAPVSALEPARPTRAAHPGLAADGPSGGDHRRHRDGDVRRDLLPPLVPADPLRRTVRPAGRRQPRARPADPRPARGDPRPRRADDRRQPRHQRRADRALGAAAGGRAAAGALPAPGPPAWG